MMHNEEDKLNSDKIANLINLEQSVSFSEELYRQLIRVKNKLVFTLIVHNVDDETLLLLLIKDLENFKIEEIEEIEIGLH